MYLFYILKKGLATYVSILKIYNLACHKFDEFYISTEAHTCVPFFLQKLGLTKMMHVFFKIDIRQRIQTFKPKNIFFVWQSIMKQFHKTKNKSSRQLFNTFFSKNADICIPETPSPIELANVGNLDSPSPLKSANVLYGRPLIHKYSDLFSLWPPKVCHQTNS